MILLIVNGDDFGLCAPVNQGIVRAWRHGILTSTSVMVNGVGFDDACRLIKNNPQLSVGLHITLTCGIPVLPVRSVSTLVDRQGCFFPKWTFLSRAFAGALQTRHLALEIRAQLQRALDAGLVISHLDSHHHLHTLPIIGKLVAAVAREFRLPVLRTFSSIEPTIPTPAKMMNRLWQAGVNAGPLRHLVQPECRFYGIDFMTGRDKKQILMRIVQNLSDGLNEFMCHPAETEVALVLPQDRLARFQELQALCDYEVREALDQRGVRLISFTDLHAMDDSMC
jgi:chitin disaccharide deacetylase